MKNSRAADSAEHTSRPRISRCPSAFTPVATRQATWTTRPLSRTFIVNASAVKLTGRKEEQKLYRYHSGYEGGVRQERAKEVRAKQPTRIVEEAIQGMLPKTKMGKQMYRKLKVYAGDKHPHAAQKPTALAVK